MSIVVVTPPSSSSAKPSVAPSRTVSRSTGSRPPPSTRVCSHGSSGRSSISPRNRLSAGVAMRVDQPRHQQHAARVDHLAPPSGPIAAAGPIRSIRPPLTATAPSRTTVPAASAVTTSALVMTRSVKPAPRAPTKRSHAPDGLSTRRCQRGGGRRARRPARAVAISRPRRSASPSASADDSREPTASCTRRRIDRPHLAPHLAPGVGDRDDLATAVAGAVPPRGPAPPPPAGRRAATARTAAATAPARARTGACRSRPPRARARPAPRTRRAAAGPQP